jgi:DNA-binding transcriptional MerR regulator
MADQQLHKVSDVMAMLGVTDQTIRVYCGRYGQFLSEHATPKAGQTRYFTGRDVQILTLIRDTSALRTVDVAETVAKALQDGRLPELPNQSQTKAAGAVAVQQARDTYLVERAGLQRDIERLQDDVTRLQGAYDAEHDARIADLKASSDTIADLSERLGRAEGALSAYREMMAARSASAITPAVVPSPDQADQPLASAAPRRRWFGLGG